MPEDRPAVLVVQLGGPERREELVAFLYELFADPEVLRIPAAPLRRLVAWTIARARARKSAAIYEAIGWSPIRRLTEEQRALLEAELGRRAAAAGRPAIPVLAGMTCSEPAVERALARMKGSSITRAFLLPLYPQYSHTTTRSSLNRVRAGCRAIGLACAWTSVDAWYDEDGFLAAHAARIEEAASRMPDPDPSRIHLLYSAHSLPASLVEKHGDPYPHHVEETVRLVNERLKAKYAWSLGYQSKVGPVEWLGPSTLEVIARLGAEGKTQVLCVPIAFVTEHVETLYEIAILFSDMARRAGIVEFRPVPALGGHPDLIRGLADLVERNMVPP